ncbi:hypothetical protein PC129_g24807 [Phytophthora cactorum]|nr:hypothetical protein PC129_g24807 [Phytophthora cactorum]
MGDIRIDASDRMEIMGVFGLHMYLLIENALLVDWALMTNLETLFIDLNGMPRDISRWHDHHQPLIREMAKHLNLKTLVVAGAPVSLDIKGHLFGSSDTGAHRDMTSEELTAIWVGILEDNAGAFYDRNYVHVFMECLRPGGQLHLMFDTDPFDRLWPRVGRIEGMDFDEDPSSVDYVSYRHIIRAP